MKNTKPVYSVVIPVYNSEKILDELHDRLVQVFDNVVKESFEVIYVDDASMDNSWQVLTSIKHKDERIKIIQLLTNSGQHNATICGFNYANGDYVITMDDDLQHLPEELPTLINEVKENDKADVVIGSYIQKKHSLSRNIGTNLLNRLTSHIFKKPLNLKLTSFRIMRKNIVEALLKINVDSPRIGNLLLLLTDRISNVPVKHEERKIGNSGYSIRRLIKDTLDNILSYSSLPLRFMIFIGFLSSIICFLLTFYYLYRYFFIGIAVPGWTTVTLLLLFFFGITLFSIGVIGEYLIRIVKEAKKYPQYIIRQKVT